MKFQARDPLHQEIGKLRAKIDDLEFEIRELRRYGPLGTVCFHFDLALTVSESRLLAGIWRAYPEAYPQTRAMIEIPLHKASTYSTVKCRLGHIRRKLAPLGIHIHTRVGYGYAIDAANREKLKPYVVEK